MPIIIIRNFGGRRTQCGYSAALVCGRRSFADGADHHFVALIPLLLPTAVAVLVQLRIVFPSLLRRLRLRIRCSPLSSRLSEPFRTERCARRQRLQLLRLLLRSNVRRLK